MKTAITIGLGPCSAELDTLPTITETNLARNYTADLGTEILDLSGIGPAADASATYALIAPFTGVSVSGSDVVISTDIAQDGSFTVRRTYEAEFHDFIVDVTFVAPSIEILGEVATVVYGTDTRPDAVLTLIPENGPYAGEEISWTDGQLAALADGTAFGALPPLANANELDVGAVLSRMRQGVWIENESNPSPADITWAVIDLGAGDAVLSIDAAYTVIGSEACPLAIRESDGTNLMQSAPVILTSPVGFLVDFNRANGPLDSSPDWVQTIQPNGGVLSVMANKLALTAGNGGAYEYTGTVLSDTAVSVDSVNFDGSTNGSDEFLRVLARSDGAFQNHYALNVRANGIWEVLKRTNGTNETLLSGAVTLLNDNTVEIEVTGSGTTEILCRINGVDVGEITDLTAPHNDGTAGFLLFSRNFAHALGLDNFQIGQPQ